MRQLPDCRYPGRHGWRQDVIFSSVGTLTAQTVLADNPWDKKPFWMAIPETKESKYSWKSEFAQLCDGPQETATSNAILQPPTSHRSINLKQFSFYWNLITSSGQKRLNHTNIWGPKTAQLHKNAFGKYPTIYRRFINRREHHVDCMSGSKDKRITGGSRLIRTKPSKSLSNLVNFE